MATWRAAHDSARFGLTQTGRSAGDDGVIVVSDSTTGPIESNTYTVDFDDGVTAGFFGLGYSMTTTDVPHGPHTVLLGGIPTTCTVVDPNPQSVTVTSADTVRVVFHVRCS